LLTIIRDHGVHGRTQGKQPGGKAPIRGRRDVTTYTLLKPIRVWQQHRSIKRKLAEIAAIEHSFKKAQGFQPVV